MKNNTATRTTWLPLLACLAFVTGAAAAPTTDAPSREAEAAGGRPGALPDMASEADGQGNSKTVRMLLELQNAPPPLEGTGDMHRDGKPKTAPTRAAGSGELITTGGADAPQASAVDWRSGLPGRSVNSQRSDTTPTVVGREGSGSSREPRQMADDRVDVKSMLPARVVAFLRENREWVLLASLGLLGMVWLAASALSQRRR